MTKICPECNATIPEDSELCPKCGTKLMDKTSDISQKLGFSEVPGPAKSKKKLTIVIVAIIIAFLAIFAIYFMFSQGGDPSKFYGTWETGVAGFDLGNSTTHSYWTFYENGTIKMTEIRTSFDDDAPIIGFNENDEQRTFNVKNHGPKFIQWVSYEIKGGKLHLSGTADTGFPIGIGLDYTFTNDDQFTTNVMIFQLTFIRVNEADIPDPTYNFGNIKWEDINISVSTGFASEETVHWEWIQLTRSSTPYYGDHAPAEWGYVTVGDEIEIGDYRSEFVTVTLTWIPTDTEIDTIFFFGEY